MCCGIMLACGQAASRGMWCLMRHAGALAWRRGPVCACTRVCSCRRIFTYTTYAYIYIHILNQSSIKKTHKAILYMCILFGSHYTLYIMYIHIQYAVMCAWCVPPPVCICASARGHTRTPHALILMLICACGGDGWLLLACPCYMCVWLSL